SIEEAKPKFTEAEKPAAQADENAGLYAQIDPSKKKPKTESAEDKAARLAKEKDDLFGVKQSVPSEDNADYMTIKGAKATTESSTKVDNTASHEAEAPAASEIKNRSKRALPELPQAGNTKGNHAESDYAEIPAASAVENKAKRALPELPQSGNTKGNHAESDYAEIPAASESKNRAKRELPELPQAGSTKGNHAESDYAEIPAIREGNANNNNNRAPESAPTLADSKPKAKQADKRSDEATSTIDSKKLFEEAKRKARERDSAKEAEKKLKILAENAETLPKEHLLKALQELAYGLNVEDATALATKAKEIGKKIHRPDTIEGFEGNNVKNMGKALSKIELDEAYLNSRHEINRKIVDKLDSNSAFHQLMKQKLSGNEEGIQQLFRMVEQAKFEALQEVTGIEGRRADLEFTGNNPFALKQGSYGDNLVQMNATPILSFLRSKKQNNKEILDTIVHELTHHDQAQIIRHKDKLPEHMRNDANLMALNGTYYINSSLANLEAYKKQPQEREAFFSGHKLGDELSKLVDKGYKEGKADVKKIEHSPNKDNNLEGKADVKTIEHSLNKDNNFEGTADIKSIEHLPNKNNNLETAKEESVGFGDNALVYGLQKGREVLIHRANQADKAKRNPILADSYIGELNLGYEFSNLSKLADKVKKGQVTEQDIDHIAQFKDPAADNVLASSPRSRINKANVEDNKKIISELLKNPEVIDALNRMAEFNEKERHLMQELKKNELVDIDDPQTSPSFTKEQNDVIEQYNAAQQELNNSRMDFFSEKTKLIAKETLERGGKVYFALDGLVTNTMRFNSNKTEINMENLKKLFDPNYEHYNAVTSRELRYLYENFKDNPNLKFTIHDHVVESPFKTLTLN
ncbi:hypothetical protein EDC44_1171, partial [Cricetibacter osteomyelitidis]